MTAAAFARQNLWLAPRPRSHRDRLLRPVKPLPAEAVAYSRAIRAILTEIQQATEQSLLTWEERREQRFAFDSTLVQDDIPDELRAIFNALRRSWFQLARDRAMLAIRTWLGRANKRHRERFHESVREVIGVDLQQIVSEERLGTALKLKTQENVALITSIPEEYLSKVERAVYQHVIQGQPGAKTLAKKIQEIGKVSEKRAKFIARDQTAKLVSTMNRERNLALGIESYKWRTSKDERVRPNHRSKEGKTFRWDDPPEDTGHPGMDFNCRCTASPIMKF